MLSLADLDLLLWASRGFAVLAFLLVLALCAGVWWVIVKPVIDEAVRARSTGDWWLPFRSREGRWGPLVANTWWSALRVDAPGGAAGLLVRWGFWMLVSFALTGGTLWVGWQVLRLGIRTLT